MKKSELEKCITENIDAELVGFNRVFDRIRETHPEIDPKMALPTAAIIYLSMGLSDIHAAIESLYEELGEK
ncbi:hypothetical protein ABNB56_07100 [Streptococcus iniae]|uniref:hypothetical protein n=1 Tax=Streptococcus iniae TaxID=1346 RepID=UPI000EFCCBFE|nr:hypothetical protein [Streptococcus iniae]RMI79758.1 hypothetical protein DIX58_00750 [Streptococcus iniae]